jgi:hypothetical protein
VFVDAGQFQPFSPAGGRVDLSIWSDLNGLPSSKIESLGSVYVLAVQDPNPPFPPSILATPPISNSITLLAGTQYWLVLDAQDEYNTYINWDINGSSDVPTASLDCDLPLGICQFNSPPYPVPWVAAGSNNPQFQIDGLPTGTGVPEPSVFLILTAITLVLCVCGAKYQRGDVSMFVERRFGMQSFSLEAEEFRGELQWPTAQLW